MMITKNRKRIFTQHKLSIFSLWGFLIGMSAFRGFYLPESDVLWEAREGQDFLKTGELPPHESFSWLLGQNTWIPNSWLWSALLGGAYNVAGIIGISILVSLLCFLTLVLAWRLIKLGGIKQPLTQLVILLVFALSIFAWISGRPQQADFLIILFFYNLLYFIRKVSFVRKVAILAVASYLLSMLWMNLHLSAIASVPFFAAGILFVYPRETMRRKIISTFMVACASFLGTLVTPFGISGLLKTEVVTQQSRNIIQEWLPLSIHSDTFLPVLVTIMLFGGVLFFFSLAQKNWLFSFGLLILSVASLEAIRFSPFLAIYALLGIGNVLVIRVKRHKLFSYLAAVFTSLILVSGLVFAGYQANNPNDIPKISPSNFNHLPANARVLTMPDGGATILLYHQDALVSLDGRNDIIGEKRYLAIINLFSESSEKVNQWVSREHVTAVFVASTDPSTMNATMQSLKWTRYVTVDGVLYVKPGVQS